ncbi:methyl-accepting chemotaxis protein [Sinorhizobium mexicanum]|uniref:Methyl-accepting chemotaxis protein n=1 Tax=Sinorhizobium mexicanum TaxID=375549 RepID=A0A859QDM6_9HYPH|nr:methyl-accepting chemotaxis protein [Sinorhizobium mexicanum]MBP1883219.1 methyl-accepting chemotaxis protein [Sinorhizobium mexicanum]QLL62432.1 methyl-accepting chemotaxis protein [Sinorhizobium mexicanum]
MSALEKIRQKVSPGIVALLWINVALIILTTAMRADGFDRFAAGAALVIVASATVGWIRDRTGPTTRIVTAMAHAATVALLVFAFSGSPLQIDMHMYFFASLAICAAWIDWRAIVGYAALVSVHHLLLYFVSPFAVFPQSSDFSRVLLHAVILTLESAVLIAMVFSLVSALVSAEKATQEAEEAHRQNAEMAEQARAADLAAEAERVRLTAEADDAARMRLQEATAGLAIGLRRLAAGDLAFQLTEPFARDFEALRHDLNGAVSQLSETLKGVANAASAIDGNSRDISRSSSELSTRTERQAASLEETAAALDQITANVTHASKRAEEARLVVAQANSSAMQSGRIVAEAVNAMGRIEQSSTQISSIIGVIDDIAFQTNLLALNAGVEAARAGEAGKGFAVVAQEVRELAQRSAQAAREIKELIRNSSTEVQNGVKLVSETGATLRAIETYIVTVNEHMDAIALSAREQSSDLAGVNAAVTQMDQVTQRNATMVEEATAAGVALADAAARLRELIAHFQLGDTSLARVTVGTPRAFSNTQKVA